MMATTFFLNICSDELRFSELNTFLDLLQRVFNSSSEYVTWRLRYQHWRRTLRWPNFCTPNSWPTVTSGQYVILQTMLEIVWDSREMKTTTRSCNLSYLRSLFIIRPWGTKKKLIPVGWGQPSLSMRELKSPPCI